jgi:hypothetical protein
VYENGAQFTIPFADWEVMTATGLGTTAEMNSAYRSPAAKSSGSKDDHSSSSGHDENDDLNLKCPPLPKYRGDDVVGRNVVGNSKCTKPEVTKGNNGQTQILILR